MMAMLQLFRLGIFDMSFFSFIFGGKIGKVHVWVKDLYKLKHTGSITDLTYD